MARRSVGKWRSCGDGKWYVASMEQGKDDQHFWRSLCSVGCWSAALCRASINVWMDAWKACNVTWGLRTSSAVALTLKNSTEVSGPRTFPTHTDFYSVVRPSSSRTVAAVLTDVADLFWKMHQSVLRSFRCPFLWNDNRGFNKLAKHWVSFNPVFHIISLFSFLFLYYLFMSLTASVV